MSLLGRVPLLFVLLWSATTLLVDGLILNGIARQLHALSYARTTGTITSSKVAEHTDSDGTTYSFEVRYTYEVNGQKYVGNRYRHSRWSASDSGPSRALAKRYPEGATVPVFHDPDEPDEAVLHTGVQGSDLFMLTFMGPFNLVMLAGWHGVLSRKKEDDLVGAFMRGGRQHVRLERTGAVTTGLMAFGFACFGAVFVVGFPTGFNPSLPTMVLTWGALLAISVYSARKQAAKLDAGDHDVILDEGLRRLSLPVGPGRSERLEVPWSQVSSISVETHTTKDSDGDSRTSWRPTVVLTTPDGEQQSEAIVDWNDEKRAAALVEWLKARLRHRQPVAKARMSG